MARSHTGALIWGGYALARLTVIDAIAWRMLGQSERAASVTDGLIVARARVRPAMTALAVVAGATLAFILH